MYRTLSFLVAAPLALGTLPLAGAVAFGQREFGGDGSNAFLLPSAGVPQGPARGVAGGPGQDELLLRGAGLPAEGAGLLAYLRRRGQDAADPEHLAGLVRDLGSTDPAQARRACADLLSIGPSAVPLLRQAARAPDERQAALARRCLRHLEDNSGVLSSAVLRLAALRQPPEAAAAVLAFLPQAENEAVLEEARAALAAVAWREGKPEPALIAALEDPLPLRRGAAVEALCSNGRAEPRAALRKLLLDPSPSVRLRASLALAQARDLKAVSTLVALLTELPLEQARQAEEYLADLAGEQAPRAVLAADADSRRRCRDEWAAWWQASEGPGLLDEVRKRTITEANRLKGEALIRQLGDDSFVVREKAVVQIKALGTVMVPLLRQAVRAPDVEVRQRAAACLAALEKDRSVPLSPTTVQLIALRRPPGAAEAILAFLPLAENEAIASELQLALNTVAAPEGKADPALVRALADPAAVRRAAAAEALCLVPGGEHLAAVRRLLDDPEPAVRLKAALALAGARQKDAVGVLIDLVGKLPEAQAALAEEYLLRLAGDRPPPLPVGDGAARQKRRDAWAAWWAAAGEYTPLVDRYPPAGPERVRHGTLLVQLQGNQVVEVGPDGKVRWQMAGLLGPMDAEVVGRDRVLVAEHNGQRVTERNRRGDVLWTKQTPGAFPIGVQRLRNGNTFIVCPNRLLEVDRAGRELYAIARSTNDVVAARRLRDGQIVCVTRRTVLRLDAGGKETGNFTLPMPLNAGDVLPNGHVVLCSVWTNKVTEYDTEGRVVWDVTVPQPMAACRRPGGNTLIAPQQMPWRVIEVDRDGKPVGEIATNHLTNRLRCR
jgi:HEAT repeat protein